jgi:putative Mg2+ transporter-C (MgtC) family protein
VIRVGELLQLEALLRLILATVIGAVIGYERETKGHPAGIRTQALVAMGACLFSLVGILGVPLHSDPTRIAAQVATGIGFIGAGAILHSEHDVHGLTTASTVWASAALGVAVAFGLYLVAVASLVLGLFMLLVVGRMEVKLRERRERQGSTRGDDGDEADSP